MAKTVTLVKGLSASQENRKRMLMNQLREDLHQNLSDAEELLDKLNRITDRDEFAAFDKARRKPGRNLLLGSLLGIALVILLTYIASETYRTERMAAGSKQWSMGKYLGVPEKGEDAFKTLGIGMLLGVVFGFLDNFGLFYGMDSLNPMFYDFASKLMAYHADGDKKRLHELSAGMMNGLGNTYSDIIGVFLGSAVLASAKSAFGVDPNFWPIDIVAMMLGCIAGAYVPALLKHGTVKGKRFARASLATGGALLLLCMFFPAFRDDYKVGGNVILGIILALFAALALLIAFRSTFSKRDRILSDVEVASDYQTLVDELVAHDDSDDEM